MVVVDASVVVKWFLDEEHADAALAIRDAYVDGRIELVAPSLLPFEVVNALRYSGAFDADSLESVATAIGKYGIDLAPYSGLEAAESTALEADVTVYDASYVALAEARDEPLYTADERLIEDARSTTELARHVADFDG